MDGMNDPMNPMGQVQISNPMNPMGTASQQAYGLSSLGRGDDSMLVHMTPNEVQGLQTLAKAHGGSLTVNPDTGLPEAGFLSSILPTIIGIAAAPFTAGTSLAFLANPFISGGLAGLGAMIASGGDLKEGLKWGLGVGGGTALGSGLQNMVNPVTKVGADAALTAKTAGGVGYGGMSPAQQVAADIATEPAKAGMFQNFLPVPPSTAASFGGQTASRLLGSGLPAALKGGAASVASMAMQQPEPLKIKKSQEDKDYGPGGKYEYKGPYTFPDYGPVTYATPEEVEQGVEHSYFGDKYNLPPQYVEASKEGGVIGMAEGGNVGEQSYFGNDYYNSGSSNLRGMPSGMPSWMANNPAWTSFFANIQRSPFLKNVFPTTTQNTTPYANSGAGYSDFGEQMFFSPSYFSAGQGAATPAVTVTPRSGNGVAYPQAPGTATAPTSGFGRSFNNFITQPNALNAIKGPPKPKGMAAGGIANLPGAPVGNGAVEGMLSGPGDGMSDSIPARIDGKQEARLATGEFVIPADVVSHLGNGASEPGAKVLYAMMDRIRKARTGNPEQGKEIEPEKFLPA